MKHHLTLPTVMAAVAIAFMLLVADAHGSVRAHIPESRQHLRARTAVVDWHWTGPLSDYTGNSYSTGLVNQLWPHAPHGKRRNIVLEAAIRYRVPFRLLLGVWGAESSFGKARSHFGLTGYFPGRGTSGNFRRDAMLSAQLFDRLYRGRYHHHSL